MGDSGVVLFTVGMVFVVKRRCSWTRASDDEEAMWDPMVRAIEKDES
jgi:hypothetical protein